MKIHIMIIGDIYRYIACISWYVWYLSSSGFLTGLTIISYLLIWGINLFFTQNIRSKCSYSCYTWLSHMLKTSIPNFLCTVKIFTPLKKNIDILKIRAPDLLNRTAIYQYIFTPLLHVLSTLNFFEVFLPQIWTFFCMPLLSF